MCFQDIKHPDMKCDRLECRSNSNGICVCLNR